MRNLVDSFRYETNTQERIRPDRVRFPAREGEPWKVISRAISKEKNMSRRCSISAAGWIAAVGAIALALWGAGTAFAAKGSAGSSEANKAAMLKVYDILNNGNSADLDQYVSPDMVDHQAVPGFPAGIDGLKQLITAMH